MANRASGLPSPSESVDHHAAGIRAPCEAQRSQKAVRADVGQPAFRSSERWHEPEFVRASVALAAEKRNPASVRRPHGDCGRSQGRW